MDKRISTLPIELMPNSRLVIRPAGTTAEIDITNAAGQEPTVVIRRDPSDPGAVFTFNTFLIPVDETERTTEP